MYCRFEAPGGLQITLNWLRRLWRQLPFLTFVGGWLADRLGRKRLFFVTLTLTFPLRLPRPSHGISQASLCSDFSLGPVLAASTQLMVRT